MSAAHPILPQPGSSIDPRDAVGRTGVTARARRELVRGNDLALTDPRRMGKTVWLDLFCADPGPGLLALKVDYEGVSSTAEFLSRTVIALRGQAPVAGRVRQRLASFFDGWEVGVGPVTVKPALSNKSALEMLTLTIDAVSESLPEDQTLVVAMDEVPMAIDNISRNEGAGAAGQLLQTLRNLRRTHHRLRWIVCGSVGFHHVLRRCGATEGVMNDLVNLPLGPFTDEEAVELAQRLTLGIGRPAGPEVVQALAERAGRVPFLIHALAHRLEDAGTGPVSLTDVDHAFRDFIHDRDDSKAVTHLVTRLDQYGERAAEAERVLDRVAVAGTTREQELAVADDSILDDLVDDHYLSRTDDGVTWRYDVLREIWAVRRRLA